MLIGCASDTAAYRNGDEYDVTEEVGKDLVKAQFAIEIKEAKTERATTKPVEKAKKQ